MTKMKYTKEQLKKNYERVLKHIDSEIEENQKSVNQAKEKFAENIRRAVRFNWIVGAAGCEQNVEALNHVKKHVTTVFDDHGLKSVPSKLVEYREFITDRLLAMSESRNEPWRVESQRYLVNVVRTLCKIIAK